MMSVKAISCIAATERSSDATFMLTSGVILSLLYLRRSNLLTFIDLPHS
jgi:hypothetical protein